MVNDLMVLLDKRCSESVLSVERQAFVAGLQTGLNFTEHMVIKELIDAFPSESRLFLEEYDEKCIDKFVFVSKLGAYRQKRISVELLVGSDFLWNHPSTSFYVEGMREAMDAGFAAWRTYVNGVATDREAMELFKEYLKRIRAYAKTLNE